MSLEGGSSELENRDARLERGTSKTPEESKAEREPLSAQVKDVNIEDVLAKTRRIESEEEDRTVINIVQRTIPVLPPLASENKSRFDLFQRPLGNMIGKFLPEMKEYFISPENYSFMVSLLEKRYPKEGMNELYQWELETISQILGKILIPDSVKPTLDNAKEVAKHMAEMKDDKLEILELCTGAGISAMMTYNEIKEECPDKQCSIITVDSALESLMMAEILLTMKGIPVRWVALKDATTSFEGVSLIQLEASDTVKYFSSKGKKFNGVISDHGINYFEKEQHDSLVKEVPEILRQGGLFQICALENSPKVALDYKAMAFKILSFGKDLLKSIPNKEKPYEIEMVNGIPYVRAINSKESAGLYMLLRENLKKLDFKSFGKYLGSVINVAKTTKKLAHDVKSPVANTVEILPTAKVVPTFEEQELSIARSLFYVKE